MYELLSLSSLIVLAISSGSSAFSFNRDGTIFSATTTISAERAVIQKNLAIGEALAGPLTCVKNDGKVVTSNDIICIPDGFDYSVDETGKFSISLACREDEAGDFSCVSGDNFPNGGGSPYQKKRDGIPKITSLSATNQASFKTRRGFSFIVGLCEFFTGGSDKCDKFFEKRDFGFSTGSSHYTDYHHTTVTGRKCFGRVGFCQDEDSNLTFAWADKMEAIIIADFV